MLRASGGCSGDRPGSGFAGLEGRNETGHRDPAGGHPPGSRPHMVEALPSRSRRTVLTFPSGLTLGRSGQETALGPYRISQAVSLCAQTLQLPPTSMNKAKKVNGIAAQQKESR